MLCTHTDIQTYTSFKIFIYNFRFRTDQASSRTTMPLTDVNETKVAILKENCIEAELEGFYKNLLLLQDLYASGYRMPDVGPDENGLVNIEVYVQYHISFLAYRLCFCLRVCLIGLVGC